VFNARNILSVLRIDEENEQILNGYFFSITQVVAQQHIGLTARVSDNFSIDV
jgi:hypothetical protein